MSDLPPPSGAAVSQVPPSGPGSSTPTLFGTVAVALLAVAAVGVLVFAVTAGIGGGDGGSTAESEVVNSAVPETEVPETADADGTTSTTKPVTESVVTLAVDDPVTSDDPATSDSLPASESGADDQAAATSIPTSAPAETDPDDSAPPATVEAGEETEAPLIDELAVPNDNPGYPVLSDGTPQPVEVVYDGATVTLTGLVPSEDARVLLEALAVAGAPQPDTVASNLLEINENVPITVGARVLSLDSVRFPEGSSEVTAEHAAELDGTVRTLEALPNATMLVIGHADQRGDDLENLALSQDRADSMLFYLVSQGIDPSRLSSRAVGESNPISEANSDAALELNRRTELIFYGLLIG